MIISWDVGGVGGFDAGLHGGYADGDAGEIEADEVTEDADTGGRGGEGEDEFAERGMFAFFFE